MKQSDELGEFLVDFVNRVSHPRGRALTFLINAGITVDQVVLLNCAQQQPGSTPSALAKMMSLSPSSVSQMLDRLHSLGMVRRTEDPNDRRRKTIDVTVKAATFLARFRDVRCEEFLAGTATLTPATRQALASAIKTALDEFGTAEREHPRQENQENTP